MANTWRGEFPRENLTLDGYERTSPAMAFPPNGYGVFDMIHNVWEWKVDWYSPRHEADHEFGAQDRFQGDNFTPNFAAAF